MTRDQRIYKEYGTMKVKDLASKYGLSRQRINAICKQQSEKEKIELLRQDVSKYRAKYYNAMLKR